MSIVNKLMDKVINGQDISKDEAIKLIDAPLDKLTKKADYIRKYYCQKKFDVCTIINVKNGRCSEDCHFCAQSIHNNTDINIYPMLPEDELIRQSKNIINEGFKRISYVASGRSISDGEFETILKATLRLKQEEEVHICVSLGLLNDNQIKLLEKYDIDRIHNNLESSQNYFSNICSTHTYQQKLKTITKIDNKNISICSGGIIGLGESFIDRIDLALTLRKLQVKSIPVNILNPIKATPLENNKILSNEEVCRTIAIFRFINPKAFIRLAGGRILLDDNGLKAFQSGANACILGNMLTTTGGCIEDDLNMIRNLGYEITYDG